MLFKRKIGIIALATAGLFSSALHAQYNIDSSWIMAEEGRAQQIFFGTKVLVGANIEFSNLGNMPYISNDNSDTTYLFDDGYINIPFEDGDFTSEFAFRFSNATEGPDGNVESITLQRYRSAGVGDYYKSDLDFAAGWELGSRYDIWKLSNRVTVGFTVAAGFSPLKQSYSTTIKGELFRQKITVPLSGPGIEYQDSGSYIGGGLGGPYILLKDLDFDAGIEERVSQILAGGEEILVNSEVKGKYELLGGMGTVRAGSYIDYYLTENLMIHLGVGVSASYLSYDFTVDQSLVSSTVANNYQIVSEISDGEWLVGAYAELNLVYRLNHKTSVYAGAQKHFIRDPNTRELDQTMMEITLGSPTQFQAGFEFDF